MFEEQAAGVEESGLQAGPGQEVREAERLAQPAVDERTQRLELIVSNVLRYGVILSFIVTVVGFAILISATYAGQPHPGPAAIFPPPRGHAEVLRSPGEVVADLLRGDPNAVVILGLLILLCTPIVRVAVSAIAFVWQRDWAYVVITLYVLTVLGISFVVGATG